jgi:hypothetical protein
MPKMPCFPNSRTSDSRPNPVGHQAPLNSYLFPSNSPISIPILPIILLATITTQNTHPGIKHNIQKPSSLPSLPFSPNAAIKSSKVMTDVSGMRYFSTGPASLTSGAKSPNPEGWSERDFLLAEVAGTNLQIQAVARREVMPRRASIRMFGVELGERRDGRSVPLAISGRTVNRSCFGYFSLVL